MTVAWYRFIRHDSLAQQLRKCTRACCSGPCSRVHALGSVSVKQRWWDEVNDNMSDCHGSSHALGCTGPYNCYSVSLTVDTHTCARTRTRAASHLIFHRWTVSRFLRGKVWYPVISRCLSLLYGRSSLWRPLLRLDRFSLFFLLGTFDGFLKTVSRVFFSTGWWGFKLEIIRRVRVATLPALFHSSWTFLRVVGNLSRILFLFLTSSLRKIETGRILCELWVFFFLYWIAAFNEVNGSGFVFMYAVRLPTEKKGECDFSLFPPARLDKNRNLESSCTMSFADTSGDLPSVFPVRIRLRFREPEVTLFAKARDHANGSIHKYIIFNLRLYASISYLFT